MRRYLTSTVSKATLAAGLAGILAWSVSITGLSADVTADHSEPSLSFGAVTFTGRGAGSEGNVIRVSIDLSKKSDDAVTVPFHLGGTAKEGLDYTVSPNPLTISPGMLTGTLTIAMVDDRQNEDDETVIVSMGAPIHGTLGENTTWRATITDDDPEPFVSFSRADQRVTEEKGTATVTAHLSSVSGRDVSVPFTVTGTSTEPEDYRVTTGPLVIPAGSLRGDITVTLVDDATREGDETVEVAMGAPVNASPGETTAHTLTIGDDDAEPSVAFGAVTFIGSGQGAEGNVVSVSVDLSKEASRDITVPLLLGGTAKQGVDYTLSPNPLTISAGKLRGTITVTVIDDMLDEEDEMIEVAMAPPSNGTPGERTVWRVVISDDDPEPSVAFTEKGQSVTESGGAITITAHLSSVSGRDVSVPFTVTGTSTETKDYRVTPGPLVIPAGSLRGDITVTLVDDALDEDDGTVEVAMGTPVNAKPGDITTYNLAIRDDDPEPAVSFALGSSRSGEGSGPILLEVSLSAASRREVTVDIDVRGGTATGTGADYTLSVDTIAFSPGETVKSVEIEIIDDMLEENDETVEFALANPSNAKPGGRVFHRHTIVDNDTTQRVAVLPVENLSGEPAPLKDIRRALIDILREEGVTILDDESLEKFMARHRIRHVGGIDTVVAKLLKDETGSDAVFVTSLELYSDTYPPKMALSSRLVSTGDAPEILWINSAGLSGDDSPGLLNLGLIEDPRILLARVMGMLTDPLKGYLSVDGGGESESKTMKKRYEPKSFFRSPVFKAIDQATAPVTPSDALLRRTTDAKTEKRGDDDTTTIAVVPFFNRSERKNAGEIVGLHFVRHLSGLEGFSIVEPGIVRKAMLETRTIMDYGLSFANADLIFYKIFDADLVLTGYVWDYRESLGRSGKATVDFSVVIMERENREVVWSSRSHNTGDEGVFMFDWGEVNTAQELASEMARAVVALFAGQ